MSRRMRILRDWPEALKKLSIEELRAQRQEWNRRLGLPHHPANRKRYQARVRDIDAEIDSRSADSD